MFKCFKKYFFLCHIIFITFILDFDSHQRMSNIFTIPHAYDPAMNRSCRYRLSITIRRIVEYDVESDDSVTAETADNSNNLTDQDANYPATNAAGVANTKSLC